MNFAKRMKVRLYAAYSYLLLGTALILVGLWQKTELPSSLGTMLLVLGLARIVQYKRITRNDETFRSREIAETDERNVLLWKEARALTFSIFLFIAGVAVIVLFLLGYNLYAQIISYTLFSLVLIYWICYFYISKKH